MIESAGIKGLRGFQRLRRCSHPQPHTRAVIDRVHETLVKSLVQSAHCLNHLRDKVPIRSAVHRKNLRRLPAVKSTSGPKWCGMPAYSRKNMTPNLLFKSEYLHRAHFASPVRTDTYDRRIAYDAANLNESDRCSSDDCPRPVKSAISYPLSFETPHGHVRLSIPLRFATHARARAQLCRHLATARRAGGTCA